MDTYENSFTLPMTEAARKLDVCLKESKDTLADRYPKLTLQRKLDQTQIPGGVGGCEPDGGLWFRDGRLVAVFEAKTQGKRGNSIERWYKNQYIARLLNQDVCYVTFCGGDGIEVGDPMWKILHVAHLDGYNKFVPKGNSCYFKEEFSPRYIATKMKEVLDYVSK